MPPVQHRSSSSMLDNIPLDQVYTSASDASKQLAFLFCAIGKQLPADPSGQPGPAVGHTKLLEPRKEEEKEKEKILWPKAKLKGPRLETEALLFVQ